MRKYDFHVKLPCEDILDEEEVKAKVEREIEGQFAYGRKAVFIGTSVRGGGELWGHFTATAIPQPQAQPQALKASSLSKKGENWWLEAVTKIHTRWYFVPQSARTEVRRVTELWGERGAVFTEEDEGKIQGILDKIEGL